MSMANYYRECPQCKGVYVSHVDYGTHEEYCFCERCGKTENWELPRDEQGNIIYDQKGEAHIQYSTNGGYGVMKIGGNEGVSQIIPLIIPVNDEIKKDYLTAVEDSSVDKEKSYLTSWNPETQELEVVFGKMLHAYQELMKRVAPNEA